MSETVSPFDSLVVPRFAEPATFFRTPWLKRDAEVDVALLGVPFDFQSNRAGARHGPAQVREMSRLVRRYTSDGGESPFDQCTVADLGDIPVIPIDISRSVESIVYHIGEIAKRGATTVCVGGDHGVTFPVIKGLGYDQPLGIIHIDSHPDAYNDAWGNRYNNGTLLRRGVEEGLIDPKRTVSVGIRGTRFSLDDRDYHRDHGMRLITFDEFEEMGRAATIAAIREVVGEGPTYLTFDVDSLDPAYCIGTGAPEPGGFTMRDAQVLLRGLRGLDIVAGDVCEVSPPFDGSNHTALNGANLMFEILCVVADAKARRKSRT
ncbi:agmatinase [Rhizobium leguminosarum]|uniref:agmatinase n=1 Tax=Rhizobium leguminosarum TaxID=384 RepID=UPI0024A8D4E0|nr:agmatinase [Rhizobium leguminosarum]MDI5930008.1 agmatinase [Rhizobium leguminosarum]